MPPRTAASAASATSSGVGEPRRQEMMLNERAWSRHSAYWNPSHRRSRQLAAGLHPARGRDRPTRRQREWPMSAVLPCTKEGGHRNRPLSGLRPSFTAGGACASSASSVHPLFSSSRDVSIFSFSLVPDTRVFTLDMLDTRKLNAENSAENCCFAGSCVQGGRYIENGPWTQAAGGGVDV